jgi:antirestriction protein ArdC
MPKTTRRQLTDEEREQHRAQQRELVKDSVEQLRSSEGWRSYLRTRRTFHSYSLGNILLILCQRETATRVAGFGAWLKLGYAVEKGQTEIRIWAPCPPTRKQLQEWRENGSEPDQKPRTHWRLASVFDVTQVAPLPPPAEPTLLDAPGREIVGASHEDLIAPLLELASEIGYAVRFEPTARGDGFCRPSDKLIVVADRLEPNARLAVLIHELGHALLHSEPEAAQLSHAQEELVVESIAYSVCDLVAGLDVSAASIPYLTSWSETVSIEVLEQTAALSDRVARRIEDRLLMEPTPNEQADEEALEQAAPIASRVR